MGEKFNKPSRKPKQKLSRRLGATVAAGLAFTAGGVAHARHTAQNEQPLDRQKAEAELSSDARILEAIITGQQGREINEITKSIPKTVKHRGQDISIQAVPTQESVQNAEVVNRPDSNFLFVPGGVSYKGHMQSLDQIADASVPSKGAKVDIDWSKVDTHSSGEAVEDSRSITFEGLKVLNDQYGNSLIVGVPSASAPDRGLIMLDLLSGAAEDGGIITVGAESDNPVTINLAEAEEGYRVRSMPFVSDQWKVDVEEISDGIGQLTDVLYERGIPISGLVDVDGGERSTGNDVAGLPIVDRYMVIANPDGTSSDQAYQL